VAISESGASFSPQSQNAHRSPKPRTEPAAPVQRLVAGQYLDAKSTILCYGCGRGPDLNWLRRRKYDAQGYDPYPPFGYNAKPTRAFDFVLMAYLMARLKTDAQRRAAVEEAFAWVRPGGSLVLVARNWKRLVEEGGARDDARAYLEGLCAGLDVHAFEAPDAAADDLTITVAARRGGIYAPRDGVTWIDSADEANALFARLLRERFVALDVETTLEEPRALCTVQLGVPGANYVVDAYAIEDWEPLRAVLESDAVEKVIHNAAFEEMMLQKKGIKIKSVFDTLIESRKKYRKTPITGAHKLGDVCERELGIYLDKTNQTSDWTVRPLSEEQLAYAAIDVEVLVDLYAVFKPPPPPEAMDLFE